MTWPVIYQLLRKMRTHPPVDFIVAEMMKSKAPKSFADQIKTSGLPIRKGRIRKRGNIGR